MRVAWTILRLSADDPTVCGVIKCGLGENRLWSSHPKFALDVKTDDPTQCLSRCKFTHLMRASGEIGQALKQICKWFEREERRLSWLLLWLWNGAEMRISTCALEFLPLFEIPASTKGGSTGFSYQPAKNLGQNDKAWKFLIVKHWRWNQTLL